MSILKESLIQLGNFTLNSGLKSDFKLECDDFIKDNLEGLAFLISKIVKPFSSVEGIPRGGVLLAKAMESYIINDTNYHLYVDDVLTTGGSMERAASNCHITQMKLSIGAVVFARGKCPSWITPLFQMPEINTRMV